MLTRSDRANLIRDFEKVFATKIELKTEISNLRKELRNDIIEFKDAILHEIVAMREELAVTLGHRDILEGHETRIIKLEKKASKTN